jgi:hypothetical protein
MGGWNEMILLGYSNQEEEFYSLELLQERILNLRPFLSQDRVVCLDFYTKCTVHSKFGNLMYSQLDYSESFYVLERM